MPAAAGRRAGARGSARRPRGWDCGERSIRGSCGRCSTVATRPPGTVCDRDRATVLGFDLTFSAPKSVSVVFALGGEDVARHVVAAHRAGVRGAVRLRRERTVSRQSGSGEERHVVPTTGLVAASFTHGVNRNLDPHLHTHVVMANMVHGTDGRWSACDHRGSRRIGSARPPSTRRTCAVSSRSDSASVGSRRRACGRRWRACPRSCSVSSRHARPTSGGTWPSGDRTPPAVPAWRGRPRGPRRHPAELRRAVVRNGSDAPAPWASARRTSCPSWAQRASSARRAPPRRAPIRRHPVADARRSGAPPGRRQPPSAPRRVGGADAQSVERLADLWTPPLSDRDADRRGRGRPHVAQRGPGPHLLGALGPRPVNPSEHERLARRSPSHR